MLETPRGGRGIVGPLPHLLRHPQGFPGFLDPDELILAASLVGMGLLHPLPDFPEQLGPALVGPERPYSHLIASPYSSSRSCRRQTWRRLTSKPCA